jgi:hypothetical protein
MNDFSETLLDLFGAGRCDRMLGMIALDWIGMEVEPHFLRNSKLKPTDVYFAPKE